MIHLPPRWFTALGALVVLVALGFTSCSKNDDLADLNETIFVRHKQADLPAYIHGNGSDKVFLIVLHGGPGGLGLTYRGPAFDRIEDNCAVVYLDQRGSGMAQGSYGESGIGIDIMAEDVLALVKVIRHKYGRKARCFLLGHSWGSTLGIATLLKDQAAFSGWIQVDGTHSPRDLYAAYRGHFAQVANEQIQLGNSISFWEDVSTLLSEVAPTFNRNDLERLNSRAFAAEQELRDSEVINRPGPGRNDLLFQYNPITALWNTSNTQSIVDPPIQGILSYTSRLSEIRTPALILWGRYDMVVPPVFAQEA